MSIDENSFGLAAASFMEQLSEEFPEGSELQSFGFIAAIDHGDGKTTVKFTFLSGAGHPISVHIARGLIAEADRGITSFPPADD